MNTPDLAATSHRALVRRTNARIDRSWIEFSRYFVTSVFALAIDFTTVIALVELANWHYLAAGVTGFAAGSLVAFVVSAAWVFRLHSYAHWSTGLTIFALIGISGLLVNLLLIWLLTDALHLDYRLSKLTAAGGSFLFNFTARKLALFSRSAGSPS